MTILRERRSLYRISARHFVAGFEAEEGRVVFSAPILRYMVGWSLGHVRDYCKTKRWKLECVRG